MPEPYALKEASTVLRGARQSNLPYLLDTSAGIVRNLKHWNKNLHFPVNETFYFKILHLRLAFFVSGN